VRFEPDRNVERAHRIGVVLLDDKRSDAGKGKGGE
jgi:hypothetical protein